MSEEKDHSIDMEELRKALDKLKELVERSEWWKYEALRKVSGYRAICVLMSLHVYGPFDSVSQLRETSGIPKSSFYKNIKGELIKKGLIRERERGNVELTWLGEKVCKVIDSSHAPIISEAKLDEIINQCKAVRPKDRR